MTESQQLFTISRSESTLHAHQSLLWAQIQPVILMEQRTVICIAAEMALLREVKYAMTEMALPAMLFAQAAMPDTNFLAKPASLFAETAFEQQARNVTVLLRYSRSTAQSAPADSLL